MRPAVLLLAVLLVPVARTSAQVSAYTWTFKGNPGGSGQVIGETLHVVGANDGSTAQLGNVSWLETSAPVALHVTVTCDYTNNDDGENDAPVWVIDGAYTKPDTGGYWGTGEYDFAFDVMPGHSFGFGIWTSDAILGAGVGDFVDFTATPITWTFLDGGIDPQSWFTTTAEPDYADSLCGIGDVDGDGVRELVVNSHASSVSVYSGATGVQLLSLPEPGAATGAVAEAGDVDGDGEPDFVLGLPFANGGKGGAKVLSGVDGHTVFTFGPQGAAPLWFGIGVAGLGDVDGDGYDDVAVGSPFALAFQGEVLVLGGPDGHVIHDLSGPGGAAQFGRHLAAIDDVDLDGVRDLAVTQQGGGFAKVILFSGATGAPISTASETQVETGTNTSFIASARDFDGDGQGDIAWWLNPSTGIGGKVTIRSGATGAELWSWPQSLAGDEDHSTVTVGDVNGDGEDDVVFSTLATSPEGVHVVARIYSGAGSHPLLEQLDVPSYLHGAVVSAFGDVDLDGATDLAVSQWGTQTHVIHALDGNGPPNLHGVGTFAAGTLVSLVVKAAKPLAPYTMVIGVSELDAPFKGGTLVPQPTLLLPGVTDAFGRATLSTSWPAGIPGPINFWSQAWIVDGDGPHGLTATNGLLASSP